MPTSFKHKPQLKKTEDIVDAFYSELVNVLNVCRISKINIILGDVNDKVCNLQDLFFFP